MNRERVLRFSVVIFAFLVLAFFEGTVIAQGLTDEEQLGKLIFLIRVFQYETINPVLPVMLPTSGGQAPSLGSI